MNHPPRAGFTLVEMLASVAALIIVLGLMVSLARYVGRSSGEALTAKLLQTLDRGLASEPNTALGRRLENVQPLLGAGVAADDEQSLLTSARRNNEQFVRAWAPAVGEADLIKELPPSMYDGKHLRDAWGMPVVYMAPGADNLGISRQNRAFCFSAGHDRRFATVVDNLYSYER